MHGELAFIGEYLPKDIAAQAFLQSRRKLLLGQRDALFATLKQFDPGLRPEDIGTSDDWLKAFGRRGRNKAGVRRYLSALKSPLPLVK